MAGASTQSAQDEVKLGETDAPKDYQEEADKPKDYDEAADKPRDYDEDAVEGVIEEPCVEPCPKEKKKKKNPPSIQPVPSSN